MRRTTIQPYLWMVSGAFAFAVMATLAHALGPRCDWRIVVLSRTSLALVFAVLLAWAAGSKLVFLRPGSLWIRSVAGSISMVCAFYSLANMPLADVMAISNVFPIWIVLLSWPLLGERPAKSVWGAVGCGIAGVMLLEQPHLLDGDWTAIVALVGSVFTAAAMLGLHRLEGIDERAIVVHFSAVATMFCLAALAVRPTAAGPLEIPDLVSAAMLLGVGVSSTVGQIFLTKAYAAGPPAKVSVAGLSQVGFAVLFDRAIWGRSLNPVSAVGLALVLAPTAWLLLHRGKT